ncbi:MAG: hypothetical protein KatS3mg131_2197 [Candidatus Tectimicrobiota bacterium]|nr:MAG: hypothetical protein KatS3mg131_2197 [Candidatus Tectomicrobia bacterium]
MRKLGIVYARELRALCAQPALYLATGGGLLLVGALYAFVTGQATGTPPFSLPLHWLLPAPPVTVLGARDAATAVVETTFGIVGVVSVLALPLLSMSLWAAEQQRGTAELLLTLPLRLSELVLGKFLAALTLYALLLCLTLLYPLLATTFGRPDPGLVLSSYVGTLLLGAALLALGLFYSALTAQRLAAAVLSWASGLALWLAGQAADLASGSLGFLFTHLSLAYHHGTFVKGLLTTADAAFFVLLALVALVCTRQVLAARVPQAPAGRRLRALVWRPPVVLAGAVALYALAAQHPQSLDLTRAQQHRLAQHTLRRLRQAPQPLKVIGFFHRKDPQRRRFLQLLGEYMTRGAALSFELVDPHRQPALAKHYRVAADRTLVVVGSHRVEQVEGLDETALLRAMARVLGAVPTVVYFVTGHGEASTTDEEESGYRLARQSLEAQHYQVRELALPAATRVPPDATVVVVAGPRQDVSSSERSLLAAYLESGGRLLLLLDPQSAPGLASFVARYGLELGNDVILTPNALFRLLGGDYHVAVATAYADHPITRPLAETLTFFPLARSVRLAASLPAGVTAQVLATTPPESWAETDLLALQEGRAAFDADRDRPGPLGLAAAATVRPTPSQPPVKRPAAGRLVVVGDADFATNAFFSLHGNGDFFLNAIRWLAGDAPPPAMPPRPHPPALTRHQAALVFWLPVLAFPLLPVLGSACLLGRRGYPR